MSGEAECGAEGGADAHPAIAKVASAATNTFLETQLCMSAVMISCCQ
jgi:hypothetical protein